MWSPILLTDFLEASQNGQRGPRTSKAGSAWSSVVVCWMEPWFITKDGALAPA